MTLRNGWASDDVMAIVDTSKKILFVGVAFLIVLAELTMTRPRGSM